MIGAGAARILSRMITPLPTYQTLDAPLAFSPSAAAKVRELIAGEGNADLKLRVFVQGGGCSGFQYGFTFDEIVNDDDTGTCDP